MKKALLLPALIVSVLVINSCDKIEDPYPESSNPQVDTSGSNNFTAPDLETLKRRILIEDYTGHTCGNCPSAAIIATGLKTTYGDQVRILGVHAGFFAEPYGSGNEFRTDFRTASGEEWNTDFGVTGNPKGMVSRLEYGSVVVLDPSAWGSAASILIDDEPLFDVQMEIDYDSGNKTFTVDVGTYVVNSVTGNYNLVVCVVEDSIVDWQQDYSLPSADQHVEDYVHEHVLRDNINGTYGSALITGSELAETWLVQSYIYTLDSEWNADHCSVLAFVADATTKEILQVGDIYIIDSH